VLIGTIGLGLLSGCATPFGQQHASPAPKPTPQLTVTDVRLAEPEPQDGVYRLEATIQHATSGGPALVTFRLRDRATGRLVETTGQVQLRRGEELVVRASVTAPPGDYEPVAIVRFPAR
jgi:hypothetical protein